MSKFFTASSRNAEKRWGEFERISMDGDFVIVTGRSTEIVALNNALAKLAKIDVCPAKGVELTFLSGLSD